MNFQKLVYLSLGYQNQDNLDQNCSSLFKIVPFAFSARWCRKQLLDPEINPLTDSPGIRSKVIKQWLESMSKWTSNLMQEQLARRARECSSPSIQTAHFGVLCETRFFTESWSICSHCACAIQIAPNHPCLGPNCLCWGSSTLGDIWRKDTGLVFYKGDQVCMHKTVLQTDSVHNSDI